MKTYIISTLFLFSLLWPILGYAATEDLTTYIETDPNNRFTITASKADIAGFTQQEDAWVYKDFTSNYFDSLDVDFTLFVNSSSDQYGQAGIAFTNVSANDRTGFGTDAIWTGISNRGSNVAWVQLFRDYDQDNDYYIGSVDTTYYCTLTRAAGNDTVYVYIYDDSGRTNLVDTLSVAGFGTQKYQYAYAVSGQNVIQVRAFTGYIENIDLNITGGGTSTVSVLDYEFIQAIILLGIFIIMLLTLFSEIVKL